MIGRANDHANGSPAHLINGLTLIDVHEDAVADLRAYNGGICPNLKCTGPKNYLFKVTGTIAISGTVQPTSITSNMVSNGF